VPYCDDKPATTKQPTWYDRKSPHTRAYEEHILPGPVNSTVSDVHMKEDVGYGAVMGITERRTESGLNREDTDRPDITGTDEIALKKGHNNSITIITSYTDDRVKISGVVGGREKQTVKDFLSEIPRRLRKGGRVVCCDMYEGYINAAGEAFGNKVTIVADRFHVAELYRKDSESLRKQEMKRLKKKLPEKEYKKLKGAMWALRKKNSDLRSDGREVLGILFRHSPLLKAGTDSAMI